MAWHWTGDKPLFEPMMALFTGKYICVSLLWFFNAQIAIERVPGVQRMHKKAIVRVPSNLYLNHKIYRSGAPVIVEWDQSGKSLSKPI